MSERMARITKTNTKPEMLVRSLAHRLGYRFRLHRKELPGNPDLVFPRSQKVVFVHGCFWHRHTCKDGQKLPKGNVDYWAPKLARNAARDARQEAQLVELGWEVLTIWECELRDVQRVKERLDRFLVG